MRNFETGSAGIYNNGKRILFKGMGSALLPHDNAFHSLYKKDSIITESRSKDLYRNSLNSNTNPSN